MGSNGSTPFIHLFSLPLQQFKYSPSVLVYKYNFFYDQAPFSHQLLKCNFRFKDVKESDSFATGHHPSSIAVCTSVCLGHALGNLGCLREVTNNTRSRWAHNRPHHSWTCLRFICSFRNWFTIARVGQHPATSKTCTHTFSQTPNTWGQVPTVPFLNFSEELKPADIISDLHHVSMGH